MLKEKQTTATQLEKAASEEGLKLLKAEHRELAAFLSSVGILLDSAEGLWGLQAVAKGKALEEKQTAQELLAKELIPTHGTLDKFLTLLRAASELCNLEFAEHQACPLCRQELKISEAELFKKYHKLLTGKLEQEIAGLRADLQKAQELVEAAHDVNPEDWDKYSTLPTDVLKQAKAGSDAILRSCALDNEPGSEAREALQALRTLFTENGQLLEEKAKAIEISNGLLGFSSNHES